MTPKITLRQRWQYFFDNFMSKGTPAMIGGLFLVSFIVVLLAGLLVWIGGTALGPEADGGLREALSFIEAFWAALMRTLDPGTMGGDTGWGFRIVMFLVTLGGIFIISALIGVLTSTIEAKLDELRKGRSQVLESGHTVILGWSPQIFTILSELAIANANQPKPRVAILAEQDKIEMEDAIRERVGDTGKMRIICRSGSPLELGDLEIVSPHTARAIIVLPPEEGDPDSYVIKTVLAVTNNPDRRPEPYHIVTQITDPRNISVVRMVGKNDQVLPLLTGEIIARVVAQTSRQSGLSVIFTELLNFGGDEIYFKNEPSLDGRTYGDALLAFEDSAVIGLRFADGTVSLNPPMDTLLAAGDMVIAVSEDDDTIRLSGLAEVPIQRKAIRAAGRSARPKPEKCLLLGWNERGATIVRELDNYVPKGSQVLVVADQDARSQIRDRVRRLRNQKVTFQQGDTIDRGLLDSLKIVDYDHVIVLSDEQRDAQEADARTLVTLLHLRDIAERDETPFSIVSEMLDLRNRQLAEVARVDDFIVSDHLISLLLTQLAENGELNDLFADLFDPEGSEIYLKPIGDYVAPGEPVSFYTLVEAARQRGETAFGYRIAAEAADAGRAYGVHTNPKKSALVTFAAGDRIIVLSEA